MSTTLFHIRKNTERKLFHIWIAVYTQYLLIRNSLSKICEIFKNTHPGLRNNKRWLGADLSFWQPLWNGEFLTYFGVVVVSTVVCKIVHKFASVWCKTALGEVGVSLPWWCAALVLLAPGNWSLFLNLKNLFVMEKKYQQFYLVKFKVSTLTYGKNF